MLCGEKEGIYAYIELIHLAVQEKVTQHCKTTKLQKRSAMRKKKQKLILNMEHKTDYMK